MKFILETNPEISKKSLIDDLRKVAQQIKGQYLSQLKYKQFGGKHSVETFERNFGSWLSALEVAGLPTCRSSNDMKRIPDEELIKDVVRVAQLCGTKTITSTQYERMGKVSLWTIFQRFGNWSSVLEKAGLIPTGIHTNISDEALLKEVERIWLQLGRQPTTDDIKRGISKYNLSTYSRRFGGWRATLRTFIEYVNGEITYTNKSKNKVALKKEQTYYYQKNPVLHRTKREPSNRLKIQVLMRDGNRCRLCGVECNDGLHNIHFDHIIPWSKGGETVLENLQVLCNKCNLAKGDVVDD